MAGGVNLYAYAGSNPVSYADPYGLCPVPVLCAAAAVAVGSAIGSAAHQMYSNHRASRPLSANVATAAVTGLRDGALGALVGEAIGAAVGRFAERAATTVAVTHFTSREGAAAIEGSGALRAESFVAVPSQVAGKTAAQVEALLEIQPGRGVMQATFKVSADALKTPFNGPTTSGGAVQFQTTRSIPVEPGTFIPTP